MVEWLGEDDYCIPTRQPIKVETRVLTLVFIIKHGYSLGDNVPIVCEAYMVTKSISRPDCHLSLVEVLIGVGFACVRL